MTMIKKLIKVTLESLKRHIIALTYATSLAEDLTDSMLAPKDGNLYGSILQRIYSAPKAFERIENWTDLYK